MYESQTYSKNSLMQEKQTLITDRLNVLQRKRQLKTCVWSAALYGAATWAIGSRKENYLENFKIRIWRRERYMTGK